MRNLFKGRPIELCRDISELLLARCGFFCSSVIAYGILFQIPDSGERDLKK